MLIECIAWKLMCFIKAWRYRKRRIPFKPRLEGQTRDRLRSSAVPAIPAAWQGGLSSGEPYCEGAVTVTPVSGNVEYPGHIGTPPLMTFRMFALDWKSSGKLRGQLAW